jgi:hypothetical protein
LADPVDWDTELGFLLAGEVEDVPDDDDDENSD